MDKTGVVTHLFHSIFLRIYFPYDINEVVAAIAYWNKASQVSSHLDDIRFGVDEGPARVCILKFVGASIKESNWVAIDAAALTFFLCCSATWFDFSTSLNHWSWIARLYYVRWCSNRCCFSDLDLVPRGE